MHCPNCGSNIPDNSKFCNVCGNRISTPNPGEFINMRCPDCGGTMIIDNSREVISCPFCGSKRVYIDSENIKIEKVRFAAKENIERIKADKETTIERIRAEREIRAAKAKPKSPTPENGYSMMAKIIIVLIVSFAIMFTVTVVAAVIYGY